MKGAIIAVFAALLAVASAQEIPKEGPFGECPPVDGEKPVYLLDTVHRDVFYECNSGRPMRQTCAGGLVFNPRKNVCTYPCIHCEPYGMVGTCIKDKEFPLTFYRDGANVGIFYRCWMFYGPFMDQCKNEMYMDLNTRKCVPL